MEISLTTLIQAPLEEVYQLVKDDLEKIVPYLPNIEKVETLDKQSEGSRTTITNKWFAHAEIPGAIKKFISPEIFCWKDVAIWDDDLHEVKYTLESFLANDLYDTHGHHCFKAKSENETELLINCSIHIYPEKIPGVPRFLAKTISPVIEGLIEKLLVPNLKSLGAGINSYLKDK